MKSKRGKETKLSLLCTLLLPDGDHSKAVTNISPCVSSSLPPSRLWVLADMIEGKAPRDAQII